VPNVRIRRAVEKGLAPVVALAEACVDEDITFVQTAPNHAWFCDRLDCNSREGR
jgi:hypothetical protein